MYSFPNLEPACCSMSSSNCCFLTCIQISQEAGKAVWYSHLLKNSPQFVVIHTVKGFGVVNKSEADVFVELSCFLFFFQCHVFFCLFILLIGFSRQEYWSGLPFPSPVDHILSDLSTMTCPSWLSFIDLDKSVIHVISLVSFLWLWFSFFLPSDG